MAVINSLISSANALMIIFFSVDVILALASVAFLVWLYVKTDQRSKRRLFAEKTKLAKKIDDDTYIIPSDNQSLSSGRKNENPMNHLMNQINELQVDNKVESIQNDINTFEETAGKEKPEKTYVVVEKNEPQESVKSKTSSNKSKLKNNNNVGNYQNFSNLMNAIKDETAEKPTKKAKKLTNKEKKR